MSSVFLAQMAETMDNNSKTTVKLRPNSRLCLRLRDKRKRPWLPSRRD